MSKFDQAKSLMKIRKIQKELERQVITIEKGDGAVKVDITADQKIKNIHLDKDLIDFEDIEQLEMWLEEAVKEAISTSQKVAAAKMQPLMGSLDLGL